MKIRILFAASSERYLLSGQVYDLHDGEQLAAGGDAELVDASTPALADPRPVTVAELADTAEADAAAAQVKAAAKAARAQAKAEAAAATEVVFPPVDRPVAEPELELVAPELAAGEIVAEPDPAAV